MRSKRRKNIYLFGKIGDEMTASLVSDLMDHPKVPYRLFLNTDGGSVYNALALSRSIQIHGNVETVCLGVALSGGADVLSSGRKRYIVESAIAMIHQVSWEVEWSPSSTILRNAKFLERLNRMLSEHLSQTTGQPVEKVLRDCRDDHFLYGQDIIDYGLADSFWRKN